MPLVEKHGHKSCERKLKVQVSSSVEKYLVTHLPFYKKKFTDDNSIVIIAKSQHQINIINQAQTCFTDFIKPNVSILTCVMWCQRRVFITQFLQFNAFFPNKNSFTFFFF